jgi:hypothetical protein
MAILSLLNIIPVLNVVAAEACKKLWSGRDKSWFRKLLAIGAVFHLLANVAFSVFMLIVSSQNYPGEISLRFISRSWGTLEPLPLKAP